MSGADKTRKTALSKARSNQEVGEFWDAHSLADHWDETRESSLAVRKTRPSGSDSPLSPAGDA